MKAGGRGQGVGGKVFPITHYPLPITHYPLPIYRLDSTSLAAANVCSISSEVCAKEVKPASN